MLNKYADFIFVCRDGEKYIYAFNGKEKEFDSPQDAQNWYDGQRGERNDGQVPTSVVE